MPRGSLHEEIGRPNERLGRYTLRREGGVEWRPELGFRSWFAARRLAGRSVCVVGVRDGFDLISVERIEALDG